MIRLNLQEDTSFEKLPVSVYANPEEASIVVASRIADIIRKKQLSGERAVLGLATGDTPIRVYKELIRLHKEEGLSFKNVVSFNLDEYYPMLPDAEQSYVSFMNTNLFNHIDIDKDNIYIPDGTLAVEDIPSYCIAYEERITELGGIDLQLLGIGRTGHIGFNEPGSGPSTDTRLVTLEDLTREDASSSFGGKENVPHQAITMGIGTVLRAKEIVLIAWGEKKGEIVQKAVEGEMSSDVPSTFLQQSNNVEFILDEGAAFKLTRFATR